MKILLIFNSYAAQIPQLKKTIQLYKPLRSSCTESVACYDISVALQLGENPPFPHSILHIKDPSPHRRWFLSAFQAYERLGSSYDWYFILDGDTFVFLRQLEALLAEYTDPVNISSYIGGSTEAHTSILNHGIFPYGGGGVLVSNHAMRAIYPTKETCLRRYEAIFGGDELLHRCFADIGVKPIIAPSFHQMDMIGDVTGLFETFFTRTGVVTLHHLKQNHLGHQPMDLALKQLTRASNLLSDMFGRRALVETMCPQNGEINRNKSFILTHGISLVQYDPFLAQRDPHLFDSQVIVKTHMFWGNRDHEHPFISGKRLVRPSAALMDRQYMKHIREDDNHIIQEFDHCLVKKEKATDKSLLSCEQNCMYRSADADSNTADNINMSNVGFVTMHVQMVIGISVAIFVLLLLTKKRWRVHRN